MLEDSGSSKAVNALIAEPWLYSLTTSIAAQTRLLSACAKQ